MVISHLLTGMILQVPGTTQLASGICNDWMVGISGRLKFDKCRLVRYHPASWVKGGNITLYSWLYMYKIVEMEKDDFRKDTPPKTNMSPKKGLFQ